MGARADRKSRRLSLTRAERAEIVKRRLFEAAVTVVGEGGYSAATVSQITKLANVAQGTFYNYYPNRQDLLDQLLPTLGEEMLDFIRTQVCGIKDQIELEQARFRAFFNYLIKAPQFMRILYEAQLYAPTGYAKHMQNVTKNYIRALEKGGLGERFSPDELTVITSIMMGARSYLSYAFAYDGDQVHQPPESVFSAYDKLMLHGLFGK
jgi:AcrR family transcriptional regulator